MIESLFALVLLAQGPAEAAAPVYVCPAEITATWNVSSAPEGWETSGADTVQRYRLRSVMFTDGHPKGQAFLKPYVTAKLSRGTIGPRQDLYRFSATYPEGIWLVCGYQNTPATVFRRLPDVPTICEVPYADNVAGPPVEAIRCR